MVIFQTKVDGIEPLICMAKAVLVSSPDHDIYL